MAEQPALGFAGLLRQLRAQARLTQEELAEAAGLSPRSVSDLERGINRTARKDTAELLAAALGLAEPVRPLFVAAARGRAAAAEVLAALRGEAPGGGSAWPGCPYLGLMPFEERDARFFYGRDELVGPVGAAASRAAGRDRDLAGGRGVGGGQVLAAAGGVDAAAGGGCAGAGVAAVAAAGDPAHGQPAAGTGDGSWPRWRARIRCRYTGRCRRRRMRRRCWSSWRSGPPPAEVRTWDRAAGRCRGAAPPRLVLVVDQFEELFTAGGDAEAGRVEREAFIAALHAAATVPAGPQKCRPALVVAAVRADFLGRLIAYPPLKAALDAGPSPSGP